MLCFKESARKVRAHKRIFVNFNLGASCEKLSRAFAALRQSRGREYLQFEWYRGIIRLIYMGRFFIIYLILFASLAKGRGTACGGGIVN